VIVRRFLHPPAAGAVALGVLAGAACGGDDDASGATNGGGDSTLTLGRYTTPRVVYEEIIPLFTAPGALRGAGQPPR